MRGIIFRILGVLELGIALILLAFASQLPGPLAVHDSVGRVEKVSQQTRQQVRRLQEQVGRVRERRPQLETVARRLESQMRQVAESLRSHQVNYRAVGSVGDALGDLAAGLEALSAVLDRDTVGQVGIGLTVTADFLEDSVIPTAEKAAERLEKSTQALKADADRLNRELKKGSLDLKGHRQLIETLAQFEDGLERMNRIARRESFDKVVEGLKGLEESMDATAAQVEKSSQHKIPQMKLEGLQLKVAEKEFWPEGKGVAEKLRKVAKGASAAHKEMEAIGKEIPRLHASLKQAREVVASLRKALSSALKQEDKLQPLLKDVPDRVAHLAEELPRLGDDLARVLRDTAKLKEVAAALRQAQKGVDSATARWPELRKNLSRTSTLLLGTQKHLQEALANRAQYESAMKQTVQVTDTFAETLPLMTGQLQEELERQELSLAELGESIDRMNDVIPDVAQRTARLFQMTTYLLQLVSALVGVHGLYLLLGSAELRDRKGPTAPPLPPPSAG